MAEAWGRGHSGSRICRTCGGLADCKPLDGCTEKRHQHRFDTKAARNNQYRRERRAAARAIGTVDRTGRGNLERKAERERANHAAQRDELFGRLGGAACACCGFTDKRALQFDHREGGGRRHRRSLPSGSAYYRALLSISTEELRTTFAVLCANCNAVKREEREEWRWHRAREDPTTTNERVEAPT